MTSPPSVDVKFSSPTMTTIRRQKTLKAKQEQRADTRDRRSSAAHPQCACTDGGYDIGNVILSDGLIGNLDGQRKQQARFRDRRTEAGQIVIADQRDASASMHTQRGLFMHQ